jgi:hypothetical protein
MDCIDQAMLCDLRECGRVVDDGVVEGGEEFLVEGCELGVL